MTKEYKSIEENLDNEITKFVNESKVEYITDGSSKKLTYSEFLSDKILIIHAIRNGIPYSLFHAIQDYTPFSESDWAKLLNISTKSLQRYKQSEKHAFKSLQSEKIIAMAEVTKIGLDVFDNLEQFKLWLNTPNFALGKNKPIELLTDSYGKELVVSELIRVQHGIMV